MTDSTVYPAAKPELLALIADARAELGQATAALSDDEFSAGSAPLDWSVKDHVAHLAAWAGGVAAMLNHQPRWQSMGLTDEFVAQSDEDEMNDHIYRQHKDKSPAEVRAFFNDTHQRLVDAIGRLDSADLQRPYSHYQPDERDMDDGRPIVWWIIHNSYIHYQMHLPWMLEKLTRIRA